MLHLSKLNYARGNCPCYDAPDETDGVDVTEAEEHAYAFSDIGTASKA